MRERLGSTVRLVVPALAVLVLLVVAGRLVVTLSSLPSRTGVSRSVTGVPDVVGRQLGQAQALMRKAGLVEASTLVYPTRRPPRRLWTCDLRSAVWTWSELPDSPLGVIEVRVNHLRTLSPDVLIDLS